MSENEKKADLLILAWVNQYGADLGALRGLIAAEMEMVRPSKFREN